LLIAALVIFVLIIAAGAGFFVWLRTAVSKPIEHESADRVISIEPGTGTQTIITRLSEAGIVSNPTALKIYLRVTGSSGGLKAGDYKFASPISPLQAINKIRRGEVHLERITIPEGYNRFEIAETLAAKTRKATAEEFLRIMDDQTPVEKFAPEARNLEGYLFPDTYSYSSKSTAADLVETMVNRFEEVFTPEWATRASQRGMTVHQIVTLASIIEKEAKVPDERPRMASVFYNRLKLGMALGSDPTFIYAAILSNDYDGNPNQPRHRTRVSPYNTYQVAGLPPGPIASPGRASLEAALYPDETDYLYFVVNGTAGQHKFSRTAAEHESAKREYYQQRELQRQQQSGSR
jgi:UPF0755 protein